MFDEESAFNRLCLSVGEQMARFCLCAVLDVRFDAEAEARNWREYAEATDGAFADGETDVNTALMAGMDQEELWETIWGEQYTGPDYRRLDELFHVFTAQLAGTGGMNAKQIDAARFCAKMRLEVERILRGLSATGPEVKGSDKKQMAATMKDLTAMINTTLKEASMRDEDVPRSAQQRMDGFVMALQKAGLGVDMTEDDVFRWFYGKCREHKYTMTRDAADQMLLIILQTMAKNNDEPVPAELGHGMSLAGFEGEFAPGPNEQEKEVYDYCGLTRGGAGGHADHGDMQEED